MDPKHVERTAAGWKFGGSTLLPFGFDPAKEIDPIAMHYLEELFDGAHIDVEFLAFTQSGTSIQTPTHQIPVTKDGVYLMRVRHPESDYEGVQFVRIAWLDEIYRGTRREPYVHIEKEIELNIQYGATVDHQAYAVRDTFLHTLELIGRKGHTIQ